MGKEIRKIQIFIVTRNEVPNEFTEIRDFTNQINRHLEKAYSVSVDLMTIDDLDAPPQKQEKYKQQICESEIVFFLIFTEMDDFMKADFEAAFEKMKKDGKPDIYTYFYKGEDREPKPLVREFIANLENGINHYWSVYSHIDTIKLKLLMCLKLSKLDMVEMEFRDGKLVIDNRDVMPLDNVPMFADNDSMKSLKTKLKTVEEEYFATKALYLEDKQNNEIRQEYIKVSTERESLKQKIEETEKQLFTQSLNMIKTSRGELTPRQREAYRLFDAGKSEAANEMLDSEEMKNDFKRKMQRRKEENKKLATLYIKEFKTKIEILETMTEYKERFSEIVDAYEEIMATAFEYGVEYDSVCDYIGFLHEQGDSKKALEIGKELEQIYNEDEQIPLYDKSNLWNTLGVVTDSTPGMQIETEEYFKKTIEIDEKLVNLNRNKYLSNLAGSYNNAGSFYDNQGNTVQAKEYLLKSINIKEELVNINQDIFSSYLANSYYTTYVFFYNLRDTRQAEYYILKAIKTYEELVSVNGDRFLPDLGRSYTAAGILYYNQGDAIQAEYFHVKAIDIYEELVDVNRNRFLVALAACYNNAGIFFDVKGEDEQAEYYLLQAINIREELIVMNRNKFLYDLASSYNNMGAFYHGREKFTKAESYLLKANEIKEELVSMNRDRFLPIIAGSYNNLVGIYIDKGNDTQAKYYLHKAINTSEELVKQDAKRYEIYLAGSYLNYAILENDNIYYEKAYEIAKRNIQDINCRQIVEQLKEFFD